MAEPLPIPLEALEDCGAILGRRGAGKSATKTLLFEHELDRGRRCCLIDPKGDGWGIRLDPDGSPSRFQDVPIFGGAHGDLALDDAMGATLGALVATHDLSCVVDLSAFSIAGMRRFMRDFAESLFDNNRAPLTLFVDEADQLAPQRLPADMATLLHRMERLIRQGRQRGIFMWMLTQRPQVLNKNLLSQAETLIAMKVTTPHDRGAIRDWMEAHDPERAREVEATLAKLAVGEAWVWVPAADFLERVQFPLFSTFDSGRTPRHGERIEQVRLPPIDLTAIAAALASPSPHAGDDAGPVKRSGSVCDSAQVDELRRRIAELETERDVLRTELAGEKRHVVRYETALQRLRDMVGRALAGEDTEQVQSGQAGALVLSPPPGAARGDEARAAPGEAEGAAASPDSAAGRIRGRKALAALLQKNIGLTERQWAWTAGFSVKGGTWGTYKAALRAAGLVEERDGRWWPTDAGYREELDGFQPFPDLGPELARFWGGKIPGVRRMVDILLKRWPHWTTREGLAADLGMAAAGGTFGTYLSRLRANRLIVESGKRLRLNPELMERGE